jgi:hypothetical protein
MFGRVLIKPDLSRAPVYDNVYAKDGRVQHFCCVECGEPVAVDLERYIGQFADPDTVLGHANAELVRQHCGILPRSLANGWPKVRIELCANCDTQYVVYVAEFEPSNGWCKGVLQGVTQLVPSNNSFKPKPLRGSA